MAWLCVDRDGNEIISSEKSSPYILTISAKGLRGEVVMHALELKGIIVGNGSACSSKNRFSRVIEACGYSSEILDGVVRLSFSNEITLNDALFVANTINDTVKELKRKLV
jgi:cysteine desulfurase